VTVTVDAPDPVPVVDQVITFPPIADKTLGDAPAALIASSDRNLPITFESLTPNICTVTNGVLTVVAAGTCTIEASQFGDDATNAAQPVTQTFEVRKIPATVTITGSGTRNYNGTTQSMTAVTDPPGLTVLMLYDGQETPPSEPGIYTVQARIIDPMYEGSAQATLSNVAPSNAAPTDIALSNNVIAELNAPGAAIGTLSTTDPDAGDTFTYSLESGSLDNASFTITGDILRLAISADYEAKNSYAVRITSADQNGLVTVKDFGVTITDVTLPQSITFGPISLKTYGDAPFAIGATGTASGIPVTYTSTGPVTISDGTATLTGTGSVTITAHQVAGGDYTAAPDVSQTFTVQSAFTAWATANSLAPTGSSLTDDPDGDGKTNLEEFAFGTNPASTGSGVSALAYTGDFTGGGTIASTGQPKLAHESTPTGVDYRAMFIRRKDHATAGLTYQVRFSANLSTWKTSTVTPTVLADDGTYQIVTVPFINFIAGRKARFFEVTVSTNP
ncbi:MAG: cadherin repeat domain-containing protein, partial [Verrucomicrobiaceae bacterium]|nr:cadherin repeat domain-containing protein [Verrucomicrobiaceae bacterium]